MTTQKLNIKYEKLIRTIKTRIYFISYKNMKYYIRFWGNFSRTYPETEITWKGKFPIIFIKTKTLQNTKQVKVKTCYICF